MVERDPVCARCGHTRGMHEVTIVNPVENMGDVSMRCMVPTELEGSEPCGCTEFVLRAEDMLAEHVWTAADCVDAQIAAEIAGEGLPFAALLHLKRESDGKAWVSPEMTLQMMCYVEARALRADRFIERGGD